MINIILLALTAYIIGSIPFALLIGKIFYKTDIRTLGSGNLGGTNTFRVLGKKAGFSVTIGDILKGTLAASLPFIFNVDVHVLIIGCFAVVGHVYPIFAKFKGGKAVATSAGVLLFYNYILLITLAALFFALLKLTKYVSLASIVAAIVAVITSFLMNDIVFTIIISILASLLIFKHRQNIKRILDKTEPKIKWM
jgi:glycerol-3-phosphate acyltransferase PlsY